MLLAVLVSPCAKAYDPNVFPGTGDIQDWKKAMAACRRASAGIDAGHQKQSINDLKKAIALYPASACFYYEIARAYEAEKDFENAIGSYKKAISLARDYVKAYCNLGVIYCSRKRYADAEAVFKKGLTLNPGDIRLQINMGELYLYTGRAKQAKESFLSAMKLPEANNPHFAAVLKKDLEKANKNTEKK